MQKTEIYEKLTGVLRTVFDDDDLVARPEMTASDVPEWDSLSHIRLMLTVERVFKVKFSAAEVAGLRNVGALAELLTVKAI